MPIRLPAANTIPQLVYEHLYSTCQDYWHMDSMFAQVINTDNVLVPNLLANKEWNMEMSEKKTVEDDGQLAKMLYVLMQPTRQKIVKLLQSGKSLYIEQIADAIKEDRRSVSFHLATLAEHGFVEGDYQLIKPAEKNPGSGRGGKFYHITPKVDEVLKKLNDVLS